MKELKDYIYKSIYEFDHFLGSEKSSYWDDDWKNRIAFRLKGLLEIIDQPNVKIEIDALARSLIDCGPDIDASMPSYYIVMDLANRCK